MFRKHFSWEDYDEYLFGESGLWQSNSTIGSYPDILVVHVGLHTCIHAIQGQHYNATMIQQHEADVILLVKSIRTAIDRIPSSHPQTLVIFQLPGRTGKSEPRADQCSRQYNRVLAKEAHNYGFTVIEREEIERRLLFKSEFSPVFKSVHNALHLESPAPNIVACSLLILVGCLSQNISNIVGTKFKQPEM
jgi:hypothetical protein